MSQPYRICFVCTGNICRSPMGEVVLRRMLENAGLDERVVVDSAGISSWHVGDGADPRTVAVLKRGGYDGARHLARQFDVDWFADRDLVLAADKGHMRALRAMAAPGGGEEAVDHVRLLREFDPDAVAANTLELSDPYYGGTHEFTQCLAEVEAACRGLVEHLEETLS